MTSTYYNKQGKDSWTSLTLPIHNTSTASTLRRHSPSPIHMPPPKNKHARHALKARTHPPPSPSATRGRAGAPRRPSARAGSRAPPPSSSAAFPRAAVPAAAAGGGAAAAAGVGFVIGTRGEGRVRARCMDMGGWVDGWMVDGWVDASEGHTQAKHDLDRLMRNNARPTCCCCCCCCCRCTNRGPPPLARAAAALRSDDWICCCCCCCWAAEEEEGESENSPQASASDEGGGGRRLEPMLWGNWVVVCVVVCLVRRGRQSLKL